MDNLGTECLIFKGCVRYVSSIRALNGITVKGETKLLETRNMPSRQQHLSIAAMGSQEYNFIVHNIHVLHLAIMVLIWKISISGGFHQRGLERRKK